MHEYGKGGDPDKEIGKVEEVAKEEFRSRDLYPLFEPAIGSFFREDLESLFYVDSGRMKIITSCRASLGDDVGKMEATRQCFVL